MLLKTSEENSTPDSMTVCAFTRELCSPLVGVTVLKVEVRGLRIALLRTGESEAEDHCVSQRKKHVFPQVQLLLQYITASFFLMFQRNILSPGSGLSEHLALFLPSTYHNL